VCLADGGQPRDSTSSKTSEEQNKDQDVECGKRSAPSTNATLCVS